jgi:hypothetical protein
MTHKHSITGCMVADWHNMFTSEKTQSVFEIISEENKKVESELYDVLKFNMNILENREYYDEFIWAQRILRVKYSSSIEGTTTEIVFDGVVGNKRGRYKYILYDFMGDFYEPPTWAYEIEKCE